MTCGTQFARNNTTKFYQFFEEKQKQERSLLEHQEQDFYTNEVFKTVSLEANTKALKATVKNISPKYLVDIGCGTGGFAIELAGLYENYLGFDPSSIPEGINLTAEPPSNVMLIRNDPELSYPLMDNSVDLVAFIASYDHIPDPKPVVQDLWKKLKPGGFMLINMTNYGYWLKTVLNKVIRKQLYKHDDDHFCVHSPESLIKDIQAFVPDAKVEQIAADYRHIPNLPKSAGFIYLKPFTAKMINAVLKFFVVHLCRVKHSGADMIVVFKKT
jgi:SAM-dependent methyltransferase